MQRGAPTLAASPPRLHNRQQQPTHLIQKAVSRLARTLSFSLQGNSLERGWADALLSLGT